MGGESALTPNSNLIGEIMSSSRSTQVLDTLLSWRVLFCGMLQGTKKLNASFSVCLQKAEKGTLLLDSPVVNM